MPLPVIIEVSFPHCLQRRILVRNLRMAVYCVRLMDRLFLILKVLRHFIDEAVHEPVRAFSGRGDKDCTAIARYRGEDLHE